MISRNFWLLFFLATLLSCEILRAEVAEEMTEADKLKVLSHLGLRDRPAPITQSVPRYMRERMVEVIGLGFNASFYVSPGPESEEVDADCDSEHSVCLHIPASHKANIKSLPTEKVTAWISLSKISASEVVLSQSLLAETDEWKLRYSTGNKKVKISGSYWVESGEGVELNEVVSDAASWVPLNLTQATLVWLSSDSTSDFKLLLTVSCENCDGEGEDIGPGENQFWEIYHHDGLPTKKTRKRRSATNDIGAGENPPVVTDLCKPNRYSHCCIVPKVVNFTRIGYSDWILYPDIYWANYCSGNCRMRTNENEVHSEVLRNVDKYPCCKAIQMKPMAIFYYLEAKGTFNLEIIPDMVVSECGCGNSLS